jgi:soluble lytic murein transglycosylase-like protein
VGQLATLMLEDLEVLGELTTAEAQALPYALTAAQEAGVEPALVMAVIGHESGFHAGAVNPRERQGGPSTGLMQVQLPTARLVLRDPTLTQDQLFAPLTNLRAGALYLRDQLRRYGDDYGAALAAYNAGTAYRDARGRFVNQGYVDDVLARLEHYRAVGRSAPATGLVWSTVAGAPAGAAWAPWLALGGVATGGLIVTLRLRRRR